MRKGFLLLLRERLDGMDISFPSLSVALKEGRINIIDDDYTKALVKRLKSMNAVLTRIASIIFNPSIVASQQEEIKRVEVAGRITPDMFQKTLKDSSLWKDKNGEMVPQYVHSNERIDIINTYENRFICMLLSELDDAVKEINSLVGRRTRSLFDISKDKTADYSMTSLLGNFRSFNPPYDDDRSPLIGEGELSLQLRSSLSYLKRLTNSQFYKELHLFPIKGAIMPTNILIHHPVYSYCYRYYLNRRKEESIEQDQRTYYSYVTLSLLEGLYRNSFQVTGDSFSYRKGKILFHSIIARKEQMEIAIYPRRGDILEIKCNYLDRANSSTLFSSRKMLRIRIETSQQEIEEILELVKNPLKDVDDYTLCTLSPIERTDRVLVLHPSDPFSKERMDIYLSSLFLVFKEEGGFDLTCPVCNCTHLRKKGESYSCPKCHSSLTLFKEHNADMVFVSSLWRSR